MNLALTLTLLFFLTGGAAFVGLAFGMLSEWRREKKKVNET
jgi:hypothetical protein